MGQMNLITIISFIFLVIFIALDLKSIILGSKLGKKALIFYLIGTVAVLAITINQFRYEFALINNTYAATENNKDDTSDNLKKELEQNLGEGETITNIKNDGKELIIDVNLNKKDKVLAQTRYSSLTDYLLKNNKWNTITVNFNDIGKISMSVKEAIKNENGMLYFPSEKIINKLN